MVELVTYRSLRGRRTEGYQAADALREGQYRGTQSGDQWRQQERQKPKECMQRENAF